MNNWTRNRKSITTFCIIKSTITNGTLLFRISNLTFFPKSGTQRDNPQIYIFFSAPNSQTLPFFFRGAFGAQSPKLTFLKPYLFQLRFLKKLTTGCETRNQLQPALSRKLQNRSQRPHKCSEICPIQMRYISPPTRSQ